MNLLNAVEGEMAVRLARGAIDYTLAKKPKPVLALTPLFGEKRGVFVTLTKAGHLRGCIGFPYPVMPLGDAIEDAAVAAATGDPRFPSVRKDELASIQREVTILTVPVPENVKVTSPPPAACSVSWSGVAMVLKASLSPSRTGSILNTCWLLPRWVCRYSPSPALPQAMNETEK